MGKSTISMAIFNSYVSLPEGIGKFIIPIDEVHHFSEGLKHVETTNQWCYYMLYWYPD